MTMPVIHKIFSNIVGEHFSDTPRHSQKNLHVNALKPPYGRIFAAKRGLPRATSFM